MTLTRAIRILEKEYEKAKSIQWVRNPLAYALYKTWRMADREGIKNERNTIQSKEN